VTEETYKRGDQRVAIKIFHDAEEKKYFCTYHLGERTPFTIQLTQDQYSTTVFRLLTRGYKAIW
jgi:Ni,Fe-hydrogenase I small subunit